MTSGPTPCGTAEERDQLWEKVDTEGADYPPDYDQPFKWRKCYTLSDVMTSLATEKDEPGHAPHQERLVLTAEDLDGLVERFDRQEEKEPASGGARATSCGAGTRRTTPRATAI